MANMETPHGRGAAVSGTIEAGKLEFPEDSEDLVAVQPFVTLGDAAHMALASLWWRLRRQGVRLPAETGVIAIRGGRS